MIDWGEPFLAAIRAEPDEDAPRLVYCDWLEEQGDPVRTARAEFIRWQLAVQVEIMPFGSQNGHTVAVPPEIEFSRMPAVDRQVELYRRYVRAWNGPIHRRLHQGPLRKLVDSRRGSIRRWSYRRGFVHAVWVTVDAVVGYADEVFSIGPIGRVHLIGRPDWNHFGSVIDTLTRFRFRELDVSEAKLTVAQYERLTSGRFPWTVIPAGHQSAGR
jgi:uncharacterized protein (TIGR02996 family)